MPAAMSTPLDTGLPAADPRQPARSAGLPLVYGVAVGGLTMAAYLGGGLARAVGPAAVPVASITALLLLGATPLIRRVARWAGSPAPSRCAAWSLAGAAPLLFLGAKIAIGHDPVISSHWGCSSGDIGIILLSPLPFATLGALAGLLAFAITASRPRDLLTRSVALMARGALILAAILVGAASFRALHHPSTDDAKRYIASLPTVAVLPPLDPTRAKVVVSARESAPATRLEDETRVGDITVVRSCLEGSCQVTLRRTDNPAPLESDRGGGSPIQAVSSVAVQHDEKHGFWIVGGQSAFRDKDLQLSDIHVQDISDALSAPKGWILGGLAGVGIALSLWIMRRRLAQRLLRIEAAREATLGENGWVTFHDDSPAWRASPDLGLPPGPVVLIGRGVGGRKGAYRSEGAHGGDEIVAGARADLAAGLRRRTHELDALGFVTVAITVGPLLAAWSSGLVF